MHALRLAGLASVVLLSACTTSGQSPLPSSPSPSPAPSSAGFTLDVSPPEEPSGVRMAIPGQQVSFLVTVTDAGNVAGPVTINATATKATVAEIMPVELEPGVVGEVWVVPDPATAETTATVSITATRGDVRATAERTIPILPMIDERAADAKPYFERWTDWLAIERPELGISATTAWQPQFVSVLLVVSHYAYFSEDWEMTIAWHNMIPPSDWTEVHLRRRGVDVAPSVAFKVDSVASATEPYEITPPEVVVR